jgi:hypothetical protein
MKWEKIKSAPRDGTRVAIAYLSSLSNNAEWIVREGRWISNENLSGVWMVDGDRMLLDKSIHGTGAELWQHMPKVDSENIS